MSERKLAAVLFSDMKGYSQQMNADEAGTLRRLAEHNRLLREQAAAHRGRVVKTVGDAFMIEFASAVEAVACALDVQRALAAHNLKATPGERIEVRVGVHFGDVVAEDGDLFGETVNLAARLEPKAPVGGVCVSEAVLGQVRRRVNATAEDLGQVALKNIAEPMRLFALRPAEAPLEFVPVAAHAPGGRWLRWAAAGAALCVVAAAGLVTALRPSGLPPVRRGGVLRVGMALDRLGMDLYTHVPGIGSRAMAYVVETAARQAPDGEVQPALVESWVTEDEGRTVVLHLRQGVRFHDDPCLGVGRTFAAADLVYSLEQGARYLPQKLPLVGMTAFLDGSAPHLEGLSADGPTGPVRLRLLHPTPFVDMVLANTFVVPAGLEACRESVCSFERPIGTGPFQFKAGDQADSVELSRFHGYWRKDDDGSPLPRLEGLRFIRVPSLVNGLAMVRGGQLDVLDMDPTEAGVVLDGVTDRKPRLHQPAPGDPVVAIETSPAEKTLWSLVVLRGRQLPLSLPKVRLAIALAFDRAALCAAYPMRPPPSGRFLSPQQLGHNPALEALGYDPARARELLAEAGFPGGAGLPSLSIAVNVKESAVGALFSRQLEAVGFKVKVVEMDRAGLGVVIEDKSVDFALITFTGATRGSEPYPSLVFIAEMMDHFSERPPALTSTLDALYGEMNREARGRLYANLERELLTALPAIPLSVFDTEMPSRIQVVSPQVEHFVDATNARVPSAATLPFTQAGLRP